MQRVLLIIFILVAFTTSCSRTPALNKRYTNGIASLEMLRVNEDDQQLLIRGKDKENPVLLFLHGGPGMPMMYMAHEFQRGLEEHFTIVHWDQRGSGKSFKKDMNKEDINVRQYMDDATVVIEYLKKKLNKKKIILAGHSWGSYLGTLLVNEDPASFHAYIGIGQVVDDQRALAIQERFLKETARLKNDKRALADIEEQGTDAFEKYLFKYGGELKNHKSFWPFIKAGLKSPEYSLNDIAKVARGSGFCSANMRYNVIGKQPIFDQIDRVNVSVFYFTGVQDYTTPFELIEAYYKKIEAPYKALIWFENSAHFPFFEEPVAFKEALLKVKKYLTDNEKASVLN